MEAIIIEPLVQTGVLGIVCAFFMWKDIRKENRLITTMDKIATLIDERLPKK